MLSVLAFVTLATVAPSKPLTTQETQQTYVNACVAYKMTGDVAAIEIDAGESETQGYATLECDDYSDDVAAEIQFRAWYASTSKRLGLNSNPDASAHCYDYRGFFKAMLSGQAWFTGKRFPKAFEASCHKAE